MEYTIRLYYNTGFNIENSPDSITVLTSQPLLSRVFNSIFIRQNMDLATIRIEAEWSNVENADYCIIGDRAYFITGIGMVADNVAEIGLQLDSIATIGTANVTVLDGHCTRRIIPVAEQDITNYEGDVLSEDWRPQHELAMDTVRQVGHTTGGSVNLIQATVDLNNPKLDADVYQSESGDISVGVPKVKPPTENTTIGMYIGSDAIGSYRLPTSALFETDSVDEETLSNVRGLGIESSILNSYTIPKDYIRTISKASDNTVQQITNKSVEVNTTNVPYEYFSGIENKKVFALYNRFVLASETSGDTQEYEFNQIYNKGDTSPSWVVWADLSPTGNPYARPKYLYGDTKSYFTGVVKGTQWMNNELKYTEGSGWIKAKADRNWAIAKDMISAGMSLATLVATSGASMGANVAGGMTAQTAESLATKQIVGGVVRQGIQTGISSIDAIKNYRYNYELVAPEVQFPYAPNLQSFVGNSFIVLRYRLKEADARRLDNYLHRYGESVDQPLRNYMFNKNPKYEYLVADNVQIKSNKGLRFNQDFCNRLARGVRIWHEIPTPEALNVGGNA